MEVLEVPEVIVGALSLGDFVIGFWLDAVDKIGELEGVLDEEDGDVVADDVPIS